MALNAKQGRFVEEYLIDLNATQAAIRAGYSKKTARSVGHENLTFHRPYKKVVRYFLSEPKSVRSTSSPNSQKSALPTCRTI